ncbi:MAG: hypothetical protein MUE53_06695 [Chitinophagales bacterium]|jgi:hypothetical protein|nr:hypothetical protein [Chitinophagales bacterium]
MSNKVILFFLYLVCISQPAFAQQARKYANEFLKLGVGARNLALGQSVMTSQRDVTAMFYNPSSIVDLEDFNVGFMHNSYFAGIANFDYLGATMPIGEDQVIGLSLIRLGIDDIPNTIDLYNPDGTIDYSRISSFSVADYAGLITYAKKIPKIPGASIGGNIKVIYRNYGSFASAWGMGIDLGAQIAKPRYAIGLTIQDVATTFANWTFSFTDQQRQVFQLTQNAIPVNSTELTLPSIHFGGNYTFFAAKKKVQITPFGKLIIFTEQRNTLLSGAVSADLAAGLNVGIIDIIQLRFGLSQFTQALDESGQEYLSAIPSLGLGLNFKFIDLNYSYNNVANSGFGLYSHVFSVNLRLNKNLFASKKSPKTNDKSYQIIESQDAASSKVDSSNQTPAKNTIVIPVK